MYKFKKEYQNKIIFLRGYGQIKTNKVSADDIAQMALIDNRLNKYIEKKATKKSAGQKSDSE